MGIKESFLQLAKDEGIYVTKDKLEQIHLVLETLGEIGNLGEMLYAGRLDAIIVDTMKELDFHNWHKNKIAQEGDCDVDAGKFDAKEEKKFDAQEKKKLEKKLDEFWSGSWKNQE